MKPSTALLLILALASNTLAQPPEEHTDFRAKVLQAVAQGKPIIIDGPVDLSGLNAAIPINGDLTIVGNGPHCRITGPGMHQHLFEVHQRSRITCRGVTWTRFLSIWNMNANPSQKPYVVDLQDCHAEDFGAALITSGQGVYCRYSSIRIQDCSLTRMGQTSTTKPYAVDLSISECPSIVITGNIIDSVGQITNAAQTIGILVDCSQSTDKQQSAIISHNAIHNVQSGASTGTLHLAGMMVLDCHAVISGNVFDRIEGARPEAIYSKCQYSTISDNLITDCIGSEAVIVMKGEQSATSAARRSLCTDNVIGFRNPQTAYSTGILLAAPDIVCSGNVIDGTTRGIVSLYDSQIINNTIRNVSSVGVELVPLGMSQATITGNAFDQLGADGSTHVVGVLATFSSNRPIKRLQIDGNTFSGFEGSSPMGVWVIHVGSSTIDKLLIGRNVFDGIPRCVGISTLGTQRIPHLDFSLNTLFGASGYVISGNAVHDTVMYRENARDGKPWHQ